MLAVSAVLGSPASTLAQSTSEELDARHEPWARHGAFAGVTTSAARSGSWSASRFYLVRTGEWPDVTRHWVIRRAFGDVYGPTAGQTHVVWADSRTCPAVERTLLQMEDLRTGWIDVPGVGREDDRWSATLDGVHHRLWTRVRDSRTGLEMSMTLEGNINTPVERWWTDAVRRLDRCWTSTPPSDG